MSNNSSPDFSMTSEDQEPKAINDTIFGSLKKKTLNDYDKELKNLKEENFNLKLRIYMLEEENAELNSNLNENQHNKQKPSNFIVSSLKDEEYDNLNENFSSSLSDIEATLVNQSFDSLNSKKNRKKDSIYDDQKDAELETLNEINQQLEEKVEALEKELKFKEKQLEEIRKNNENIQEKYQLFKLDFERDLFEKFTEKLESELSNKLDEAYQESDQREKSLQNEINVLKNLVDQKNKDINSLEKFIQDMFQEYNNSTKNQKFIHMEGLTEKEKNNQKIHSCNSPANSTSENLHDEIVQNHIKSIKQDLVESLKTHYQFIVSDLENQLQLKENLLQKYILIVKDKDYQINQLINVNLFCNEEKSRHKLELFISDLRQNLADKDELYEQLVKNHFDLLKQKDDLIINLRSTQKQLHSDLNKANEILLESENSVEILKNEVNLLEQKNSHLVSSLDLGSKKTKELIADHRLEMEEKDQLINNLNNNRNDLKERLKKKNEKCQLTYFYEQQLEEKDFIIADLNEKNSKLMKKLEKNSEESNKNSDESLNLLTIENNQLKNSLSKANLKLEQLEEDHIFRVDELEIEIENLSKKLREKENTIQNLVMSAEEKDDLIGKLKSNLLDENKSKESLEHEYSKPTPDDLLASIQEKDKQIEKLKTEIENLINKTKSTSISDLSESLLVNSKFNNSSTGSLSNDSQFKFVMDLLEKELKLYKKLNTSNNKDANDYLKEISNLRNQLLKLTILRENRALASTSRFMSSDNLNIQSNSDDKNSVMTMISPGSTSTNDSGLNSQKSDTTIDSNLSQSKSIKSSSTPKLTSSTSSLNSAKISELTLKNFSREELIAQIQQINSENSILKRQLDNKGPKITEIHKENSNLRQRLESSEKINDYLRKQLELHHISHGNVESLFEMAQKLNLTKEQLEQYKQKLSSSNKDLTTSRTNVSNLANSLSSKLSEVYANHDSGQNLPSKNIKVTIATLEKQLENLKNKYQKLKELYSNSERKARYLAIKFFKYTPYLNDLGFVKENNLRKCLSDPNLNSSNDKQSLSDHQLNKLVENLLKESEKTLEVSRVEQVKEQKYEVTNEMKYLNLKNKVDQQSDLVEEYYKKLSHVFNGFRSLKAQSKYLKQLFGESLFQKLQSDFSEEKVSDNLVHKIFSGAFTKFEELCNELQEKRVLIEKLEKELEELKSERDSNASSPSSEISNSSEKKLTSNIEILDLNQKLRHYKDENKKLKEKIKTQNFEIEEAIQQLIAYNKEKENTKILLNQKKQNEIKKFNLLKNDLPISEKLYNTHSKLKKARNNIQLKIENNQKTFE